MSVETLPVVADRLTRRFGAVYAARDVSFTLPRSTVLLVIGSNGSGKTTLLRVLATALKPTAGRASVFGVDLTRDAGHVRRLVTLVPASPALYDSLSGRENVAFAAAMSGVRTDPDTWFRRVGLSTAIDLPVRTYSQGMKRRLALACAWLRSPALLLLDEPFSGLDREGLQVVERLITDVKSRDGSVIISTHEWERGKRLADFMITLAGGRVRESTALLPPSIPAALARLGAEQ